jgi:hypothetical protein
MTNIVNIHIGAEAEMVDINGRVKPAPGCYVVRKKKKKPKRY